MTKAVDQIGECVRARVVTMGGPTASAGVLAQGRPQTLREIVDTLKSAYCGTIGVEFMHIPDMEQANWIRNKFEKADKFEWKKVRIIPESPLSRRKIDLDFLQHLERSRPSCDRCSNVGVVAVCVGFGKASHCGSALSTDLQMVWWNDAGGRAEHVRPPRLRQQV
jgi:hypothetical protein